MEHLRQMQSYQTLSENLISSIAQCVVEAMVGYKPCLRVSINPQQGFSLLQAIVDARGTGRVSGGYLQPRVYIFGMLVGQQSLESILENLQKGRLPCGRNSKTFCPPKPMPLSELSKSFSGEIAGFPIVLEREAEFDATAVCSGGDWENASLPRWEDFYQLFGAIE